MSLVLAPYFIHFKGKIEVRNGLHHKIFGIYFVSAYCKLRHIGYKNQYYVGIYFSQFSAASIPSTNGIFMSMKTASNPGL